MRLVFDRQDHLDRAATPLSRAGIYRILICRTVHTLGDSLTLTPLLQELADVFPGAEVDIVNGSPVAHEIYGGFPNIGEIIQLPARIVRHPLPAWRALRRMRARHYDLAIDPDPESQSGRLLVLLANKTWSLGFLGRKKSGKLTHGVSVPALPRHKGTLPVYLLRCAIDGGRTRCEYPLLTIQPTAIELRQGREIVTRLTATDAGNRSQVRRIGIFANATGDKNLGEDWWRRFLDEFSPRAPDCDLIEILPAFGRSLLGSRYPAYFSGNVRRMSGVIANLSLHVSADCGVMHLASASGTPTIGIFTVTDASEWGPYGDSNHVIDAHELTPEQVAARVLDILESIPVTARALAGASR